jgi:hypothetical protein
MPLVLLVAVASAVLFYRAAETERLSPLLWGASSLALTAAVALIGRGIAWILVVQGGLYLAMWYANTVRRRK